MNNRIFNSALQDSQWLDYQYLLLKNANDVVKTMEEHNSVLIHCSDGWDRTSQLVALSQLLIDPYYRTIEGFAVLVEKDWISFGHQFGLRNVFVVNEDKENKSQVSPIFIQWLDSIHQLIYQFPNAFEFRPSLLVYLAKSSMTNLYGTFLFNNDLERMNYGAKSLYESVWSDILHNKSQYINPFYKKDSIKIIHPNYAPFNMQLWRELFMFTNTNIENDLVIIDNNIYKNRVEYFCDEKNKSNNLLKMLAKKYNENPDDKIFKDFDKESLNQLKNFNK